MLIGREIMMGDTSDLDAIRYQWKIERLEEPNLNASEAHALMTELGRARYLPARPVIERLLLHPNHHIHEMALTTLAGYFDLLDYWETARQFMWHDPDPNCRDTGIEMVSFLKRNTNDARTLAELARFVLDTSQDSHFRGHAYAAMLQVRHFDRPQQWELVGKDIEEIPDVDWAWVAQCHQGTTGE